MLLSRLLELLSLFRGGQLPGEQGVFFRQLVHSPAVELAIKATPTPFDDVVLQILKVLVPPPGPPATPAVEKL